MGVFPSRRVRRGGHGAVLAGGAAGLRHRRDLGLVRGRASAAGRVGSERVERRSGGRQHRRQSRHRRNGRIRRSAARPLPDHRGPEGRGCIARCGEHGRVGRAPDRPVVEPAHGESGVRRNTAVGGDGGGRRRMVEVSAVDAAVGGTATVRCRRMPLAGGRDRVSRAAGRRSAPAARARGTHRRGGAAARRFGRFRRSRRMARGHAPDPARRFDDRLRRLACVPGRTRAATGVEPSRAGKVQNLVPGTAGPGAGGGVVRGDAVRAAARISGAGQAVPRRFASARAALDSRSARVRRGRGERRLAVARR